MNFNHPSVSISKKLWSVNIRNILKKSKENVEIIKKPKSPFAPLESEYHQQVHMVMEPHLHIL